MTSFYKTEYLEQELSNAGFEDIINSPFMQRLKGVSFLSTIDYIYDLNHRFSRYDHSLGVAYIALILARNLELSDFQSKVLVIANMLHDVGHSPFSHAAETFLLEKKNKYHESILKSYIRYNTRLFPDAPGLKDLLSTRADNLKMAVFCLLQNRDSNDSILQSLFDCSINCDKIDGTNRTLYSLGLDYYNPLNLINCFKRNNNKIYIKRDCGKSIYDFWLLKKNVYENYIYTMDVMSSEAMLTRSLEIALDNENSLISFLSGTDDEIINIIMDDDRAKRIIIKFINRNYYKPVSISFPLIFNKFKGRIISARFDKIKREAIEKKIANIINTEPIYTITHFSFRKDFKNNPGLLHQLNIFDDNNDMIPIDSLNKAFYTERLSGEFFDIFIEN
jgi:hypothetical protein